MAKKNNRKKLHFFSSPFSPKKVLVFGVAALFVILTNLVSIQKQWKAEDDKEAEERKKMASIDIVNILGASTVTGDDDAEFRTKKDVAYWYSVVNDKPTYRDGYLMLATLAYNDRYCTIAKKNLSVAYMIDPNLVKDNPIFQAIDKCK